MVSVLTSKNSSATKLAQAVEKADKQMKPFRQQRKSFLREWAGPYYGKDPIQGRQPMNLLYSTCAVLLPTLTMRVVKADVQTKKPELEWFALLLAEELNALCKECDAAKAFRRATFDSLFGMGILKVGLAPTPVGEFVEVEDYLKDPGKVFVETVDLDDYVIEQTRRRSAASFEGDRYRVPLSWALETDIFSSKAKSVIEAIGKAHPIRQDKVENMSVAQDSDEEFIEHVELLDLWLPKHNAVVTIPSDPSLTPSFYLREVEWEGPERGPYEVIAPIEVPSNVLPLPFIATIYDLYELVNTLAKKVAQQAEHQKEVIVYDKGAAQDADAVRKADDQEFIGIDNVNSIKPISLGGVKQDNYRSTDFFHAIFERIAGNPSTLGGLQAKAPTLGQEQMLYANALARVNDMRNIVHEACSKVLERMAWYLWTDPIREHASIVRFPGGLEMPIKWTPDLREGDFLDYNFSISAYSTGRDSPEMQYKRLMDVIQTVILPLSPVAEAQGVRLDVSKLIEVIARQLDLPALDAIFQPGEGVRGMPAPAGGRRTEITNVSMGRPISNRLIEPEAINASGIEKTVAADEGNLRRQSA